MLYSAVVVKCRACGSAAHRANHVEGKPQRFTQHGGFGGERI